MVRTVPGRGDDDNLGAGVWFRRRLFQVSSSAAAAAAAAVLPIIISRMFRRWIRRCSSFTDIVSFVLMYGCL